jgi:dCMP deaminase
MENRISREDMFMQIAEVVLLRSSCLKKQVGCVLVKEGRIVATGYNGVLPGDKPEDGIDKEGITHTVHAEGNLIAFCAKKGIPTDGCILYTTLSPCENCAELIIQSGIKRVVYLEQYRERKGLDLLVKHEVQIICHQYTK